MEDKTIYPYTDNWNYRRYEDHHTCACGGHLRMTGQVSPKQYFTCTACNHELIVNALTGEIVKEEN